MKSERGKEGLKLNNILLKSDRNSKRPIIIAFCGIDGSGKTTQILELKKNLEQQGLNIQTTKVEFHNLEVLYKLSDDMFGDPYLYGKLPADVVRLGIAYDFAYHYLSLEKEWGDVDVLLCDRHKTCFLAYGKAYGVTDFTWIKKIMDMVIDPDLIFYFDTDISTSNERLKERTEKQMRIDEQPDHLQDVKSAYEFFLNEQSNVMKINGNLEIKQISKLIEKRAIETIKNMFG